MEADNVKKLFEIRQRIKKLQIEEEKLRDLIKDEMIRTGKKEVIVSNISVRLRTQHRIQIDDEIIPFLKANGYSQLVIEKCHQDKFKEMLNKGAFQENYDYIKDYIKTRDIYYLYVNHI